MSLGIYDTNADGTLIIMGTTWDSNGALRVTIADRSGFADAKELPYKRIRQARSLARKAMDKSEKTRSSRLVRAESHHQTPFLTFAVSRLETN